MLGHEVGVVALHLQLNVVDDAALGEGPAQGRGLEHADLQILQLRIVETGQLEPFVVAIGQHVGGLVDRNRGQHRSVIGRHVEQHVAHALIEGLPRETALQERAPVEGDARAERIAEHLGHLVLEALPLMFDSGMLPGSAHTARSFSFFAL